MKKRICIITSSFPKNKNDSIGGGVFVKDFALLLSQEDFDVFVLAPGQSNTKNDFEPLKVNFFPKIGNEFGLSSYNPKNFFDLIKLFITIVSGFFYSIYFIKKNKIDYCLAAWAIPSGIFTLTAKIFFNKPYFVWSLGSDIWKINNYPLGNYFLKKILKNATNLFADGLKLANDVEKISNRKCDFLASSRILDTTNTKCNYDKFDQNKINFMFLGRYHQNKGIDLLINAISLLKPDEKSRSLFHIFGGGPLENQLKQMVEELNLKSNTFVNGYLDSNQVFAYMNKSDFIIIPSRIESIPVVLSDAINSSKPVIVSNVGDMGKLISNYKTGIVVQPNADSIADGISLAIKLDQDDKELFLQNMEKLKNYLDLKNSVKSFIKFLN